jgi:hypothetical protein
LASRVLGCCGLVLNWRTGRLIAVSCGRVPIRTGSLPERGALLVEEGTSAVGPGYTLYHARSGLSIEIWIQVCIYAHLRTCILEISTSQHSFGVNPSHSTGKENTLIWHLSSQMIMLPNGDRSVK